jgi:hypothetical protein
MTYATGQRILAADFNGFTGGNLGANVSGQLNTILGGGYGSAGYGQAAVSNVTVGTRVLASNWTSLINGVNTVRKHQSSSFSNVSGYTTGTRINANTNISGNLTTAYTNKLNYSATGTTTTGSTFSPNFTAPNDNNPATFNLSRVATFASADQARYFFNAGGQLNFVVTGVTNTGGTSRGSALANLAATNLGSLVFRSANNGGRTGSGGTVTSSNTSPGYYTSTTANSSVLLLNSTSGVYTSDTCNLVVKTNGVQGSYADNGTTMTVSMVLFSAASGGINDSIDITVNHRVDVVYPSTTFLANTWGSVTIS